MQSTPLKPFSRRAIPVAAFVTAALLMRQVPAEDTGAFCEIRIVDDETGRGVPLAALTTVNDVTFVTDNAGRIALPLADYDGRRVFFQIQAQGYDVPKDGFGIAGVRLQIESGGQHEIPLQRRNVAERLYRITGVDRFRDSRLLGYDDIGPGEHNGRVVGQDSVQATVYRGRIHWFWGDTNRLSYPLGLFRTAGATTALPENGRLQPVDGFALKYFVRDDGFARAMVDVADPKGVVWVDGVCTVTDTAGHERMLGHYSRRPGLAEQYEHGILLYNDDRDVFEVAVQRDLDDSWRFPHSHPVEVWSNAEGTVHSATRSDRTPTRYLY